MDDGLQSVNLGTTDRTKDEFWRSTAGMSGSDWLFHQLGLFMRPTNEKLVELRYGGLEVRARMEYRLSFDKFTPSSWRMQPNIAELIKAEVYYD